VSALTVFFACLDLLPFLDSALALRKLSFESISVLIVIDDGRFPFAFWDADRPLGILRTKKMYVINHQLLAYNLIAQIYRVKPETNR